VRYPVRRFKSMRLALNEIAKFVREPLQLQIGKPIPRFGGLRPRELLANWLICAAFNEHNDSPDRLSFIASQSGDEMFGDGILHDTATGKTFPTEHVIVAAATEGKTADLQARILEAINDKNNKGGAAYASGKTLVVFLNDGTDAVWWPNSVTKALPDPLHFGAVWVVGLHSHDAQSGEYTYSTAMLELVEGNAPTFVIRTTDFDSWTVTRIQ
jgi:hypothetical protein